MNPTPEQNTDLPEALAETVRGIATASLDEQAIERVRLAARQLASPQSPTPSARSSAPRLGKRSPWKRLTLALSLAVVMGLGAWHLVGPSGAGTTLYAQVREAARKVNTIQVVAEQVDAEGRRTVGGTLSFARGVGFACQSDEFTRIDDGQFLWEHTRGANFGSRTKSQGPDSMLDQALDIKLELDQHCRRFESGDRDIDGLPCRCYQVIEPPLPAGVSPPSRSLARETFVYLSDDSLVRSLETLEQHDGKWQLRLVRTWKYNVDIPPATFRPDFGQNVDIVDADEAFRRLVDLQTAVHVIEREGLIYGVHRAVVCENGAVALMASVRGTEDTLRKFPVKRRMMQPGLYFVEGPATHGRTSPQGHGWFQIELAQADHDGINVKWWVLVPRGQPGAAAGTGPTTVDLELGVVTNGAYAEHRKDAQGVRQSFYWRESIPVSRPQPPATLSAAAEAVYREVALLRACPFKHLDLGVTDQQGVPTARLGNVESTPVGEFAATVVEHVKYWERNDIDYQIREGRTIGTELDPSTGKPTMNTVPAAYLAYYPLVNDETLQRIVTLRPDVRIISLRRTGITSEGLTHLAGLRELENLDLAETQIDDSGLTHLAAVKSLKRLDLSGTQVTDAGVARLKSALPELEIVGREAR